MNTIIETQKLTKIYGKNEIAVTALNGIDLSISEGEFTAIVGPSGSGKTTFMNMVTGIDTPSSGEIIIDGKRISLFSGKELAEFRKFNLGFVFQSYNLIPVLTVEENIEYVMLLQGKDKEFRRNRVNEILAEVGLSGFGKRLPTQLSGGQQQRVAVARAMASRPRIIIADEPTANLDSSTGSALLDMMQELNERERMTFLVSTHDDHIMSRAHRIITLKDGTIDSDVSR